MITSNFGVLHADPVFGSDEYSLGAWEMRKQAIFECSESRHVYVWRLYIFRRGALQWEDTFNTYVELTSFLRNKTHYDFLGK